MKNTFWIVFIYCLLVVFQPVWSICPDQIEGLERWSDPETWPENSKPAYNSAVFIESLVLMDESPPKLHSIVIQPGGRLIWGCDDDYTMYVDYILIHGRMDIGSEDCKYNKKARIILTGLRGEYDNVNVQEHEFGQKFIGVAPGGTLELHGEDKLSWTKLTRTVPKLGFNNGLIFSHEGSEVADEDSWKPGLLVYVIDELSGHPVFGKYYYLGSLDSYWSTTDLPELIDMMTNLEDGKILAVAVNKNAIDETVNLDLLYNAIEFTMFGLINGVAKIRELKPYDAYTVVAQKGAFKFNEDISPNHGTYTQYARSDMTFPDYGIKITMESFIDNQLEFKSRVDMRIASLHGAYPILNLLDYVSTWHVGDKVVLTSTDYDWEQTEEAIIVPCPECYQNQIKVEMDSKYMHWGEMIDSVDERGEVALLTRNILIEGQMQYHCPPENGNCEHFNYDTFGGHLKFVRGFKDVHVEGVELYHMGQQTGLGTYPIHFHMAYEVGDREHPPYANDNSVHKSYARCFTVHGTHGVTLKRNVGYDSLGHCYFLEDGGEKRTLLDGNIGFSTRRAGLIPSDSKPSTYWITNPLTYLRNNVAAGSEYIGIWHVFPDEPVGLTKGLPGFMELNEAKHTPYSEWFNNVAHSNPIAGLYIDNIIYQNETVGGENDYAPRKDPLDPGSEPVSVDIIRPTLYKNRHQNAFIRGGGFNIIQGSFADSATGITFARSTDQVQYLMDSVIIGESRNIGEPTKVWEDEHVTRLHKAFPINFDLGHTIRGLNLYDSSVYLLNVWFSGFKSDDFRDAGAISFMKDKNVPNPTFSTFENVKFSYVDGESTGNRIFDSRSTSGEDGVDISFLDLDGSVTGVTHAEVFRIGSNSISHLCHWRENWNVAVCPQDDKSYPSSLAASSFWPPGDWGAGLTRTDFPSSVDGGFSIWTDWGSCKENKIHGYVEWRYRSCTNPVPQQYGSHCSGPISQSRPCENF